MLVGEAHLRIILCYAMFPGFPQVITRNNPDPSWDTINTETRVTRIVPGHLGLKVQLVNSTCLACSSVSLNSPKLKIQKA